MQVNNLIINGFNNSCLAIASGNNSNAIVSGESTAITIQSNLELLNLIEEKDKIICQLSQAIADLTHKLIENRYDHRQRN